MDYLVIMAIILLFATGYIYTVKKEITALSVKTSGYFLIIF